MIATRTKKNETPVPAVPEVPQLASDPEYKLAYEKKAALRERLAKIDRTIEGLEVTSRVLIDEARAELLYENPGVSSDDLLPNNDERIRAARAERGAVAEAFKRSEHDILRVRDEASARIHRGLLLYKKGLTARFAAALTELSRLADEDRRFVDVLVGADVAGSQKITPWRLSGLLGAAGDTDNLVNRWLREMRERGLLGEEEDS